MDKNKLLSALEKRAKQSLTNANEVSSDALDVATNETIEEIKDKTIASWAVMDFAYARLKIYLKLDLGEDDMELFKVAKKEIERSPVTSKDTGRKQVTNLLVEDKNSNWN